MAERVEEGQIFGGSLQMLKLALTSGSPTLLVTQGHQLARRPSFSKGFLVVPGRRTAVFVGIAGEPDFPIGITPPVIRSLVLEAAWKDRLVHREPC